jgi:hypothetical protein
MADQQPDTNDEPVAYDTEGRPLYYRPEKNQEDPAPVRQRVSSTTIAKRRAAAPPRSPLTPAEVADHERSIHDYPEIQFSSTEYVVLDVERSVWGLIQIWLWIIAIIIVIAAFTLVMIQSAVPTERANITLIGFCVLIGALLAGGIATHIFRRNYFIVTNERIFARSQISPFSHHTQIIEIEHVEDCSIKQSNIMQTLLKYGTLRLSTIGDEQTYLFTFVVHPDVQFKIISKVIYQVDEGETSAFVK